MQTHVKGRRVNVFRQRSNATKPANKTIDSPKEGMECIHASRAIIAVCREFIASLQFENFDGAPRFPTKSGKYWTM